MSVVLSVFANLDHVQSLSVSDREIENLAPLQELRSLRALDLVKVPFVNPPEFRRSKLERLTIKSCFKMHGFGKSLKNCATLRTLILHKCEQVGGIGKIDSARLEFAEFVGDIFMGTRPNALQQWATGVKHLVVGNNVGIQFLECASKLLHGPQKLDLFEVTNLKTLNFLEPAVRLTCLRVNACLLFDLNGLRFVAKFLRKLNIANCFEIADVSDVGECELLEHLDMQSLLE